MNIKYQYAKDRYILSGGMYDADDADSVSAWNGEYLLFHAKRTIRGKWRIESSDGHIPVSWERRTFRTPKEIAEFLANRWDLSITGETE